MDPNTTGVHYLQDALEKEDVHEKELRPPSFEDFRGQRKTVEKLQVMVGAARDRGEALNHILLNGPPGLGKTTLAHILGREENGKDTGAGQQEDESQDTRDEPGDLDDAAAQAVALTPVRKDFAQNR